MNLILLLLDPLTKKFLDASLNNVFGFVKLIRFQGEQDLEQKSSPTKDSNQNKTSGGVLVEKSS